MNAVVVALLGNPNCGKTTLFNHLTGKQQEVGNWCGVTVEKKRGWFIRENISVEVMDLPGCYHYSATVESALDEQITHQYLASNQAELIINVVDASNLERHLYLTLQLLEKGIPVIVALNMMDEAEQRGIVVDTTSLAKRLGCPVVPMVAKKSQGIEVLQELILQFKRGELHFTPWPFLPSSAKQSEVSIAIAKDRYDLIHNILGASIQQRTLKKSSWTERIDAIVLNRFLGIPIFLAAMYAVFVFTIQIAGTLQPFFDSASRTLFIDFMGRGLGYLQAPSWFIDTMTNGVGQGINTTLSFIPVIAAMFLSLSFLEGSGYMARAAFVMDKVMQWVGLPGKSFVPMVIGFGCNVPAVMATRTLENYRERLLTILMSPFMSCGARLAIYALFVSAFFPERGQNIIFGLYLIGILIALITGFVLRSTVLQGETSPLIIELPPYRWPSVKALLRTTKQRVMRFIVKAGVLIVPLCLAITSFGVIQEKAGIDNWLPTFGRHLTPIFSPMGIEKDNWPATVGLLSGVLAKEVVVGTLNSLYTQEGKLEDPLLGAKTNQGAMGVMVERFGSTAAAFAYLLFVLLYFPCVSVVVAIARELNKYWAAFSVLWTTGIAYMTAVLFYQTAMFSEHPKTSLGWIVGMLGILLGGFYSLRQWMQEKASKLRRSVPTQILIEI